jgi:DNA-binding NarL/FixJ family response regulator
MSVQATERIMAADPEARIVLVTTFDLDGYLEAGRRAGACGFLLKDTAPAQLLAAIRTVAGGATAFSAIVAK